MEIEAVYEEGVFKPPQKVDLEEGTHLTFMMGKDRVKNAVSGGNYAMWGDQE